MYVILVYVNVIGDDARVEFHLDKYLEKTALQAAVKKLPYRGGHTNIAGEMFLFMTFNPR